MKISQLLLTVSVVLNSLLLAAQEPVDSLKTETLTLTENSQETEIDTINEAWKVRQFENRNYCPNKKLYWIHRIRFISAVLKALIRLFP
jgi:hypothetical protein